MEQLCNSYVEMGQISKEEKAGILERESLVSTEIVDGVAMPHGLIQKSKLPDLCSVGASGHVGGVPECAW